MIHQKTHPDLDVPGCFGCRVSSVSVGGVGKHDRTTQQRWDHELDRYAAARANGIQPDGTTNRKIDQANAWSEKHQMPYSQPLAAKVRESQALDRLLNK